MRNLLLLLGVLVMCVACGKSETPTPQPEEPENPESSYYLVDEDNDLRLQEILAKEREAAEVDDEAFLAALKSSVFYAGRDEEGDASGCSYGSPGMYHYYKGRYYYYTPREIGGLGLDGTIPRMLLFMDGGEGRHCVLYNEFIGLGGGDECYKAFTWEYDAERNVLVTRYEDGKVSDEAEVLYADAECAILKGAILEYYDRCDYIYFYADFTKYDYDDTVALYAVDIKTLL